jgi:hypothetical protein
LRYRYLAAGVFFGTFVIAMPVGVLIGWTSGLTVIVGLLAALIGGSSVSVAWLVNRDSLAAKGLKW